jgi:hypothetical protein
MRLHFLLAVFFSFLTVTAFSQRQKAPMYFSAYAYLYTVNQNQATTLPVNESRWQHNIDYISEHLASLGFDMICTDGWGEDIRNSDGFRIKHHSGWTHDYSYWAGYAQQKGVKLGLYENPLWINEHVENTSHLYDPYENATWFNWLQVDAPGAEDYVRRYIEFYKSFGVEYLRIDFLSWYEDGIDKTVELTNEHGRTVEDYQTALSWLNYYCDVNDIQLSLVMPHLYNHGANERQFAPGSMIRVNEDACEGTWYRFGEIERGIKHDIWSQYWNTFDGLVYWSDISGFDESKNEMILDGDFIWLSSYDNDEEKKTVLSLNLMAGGAIALTEYDIEDIQQSIHLLQNQEVFELNSDGFVGKPLSHDPLNAQSQIWIGQMSQGDYVIGFFNREDGVETRSLDFSAIGLTGEYYVRDLWMRTNLGAMTSFSSELPPHGCRLLRLSATPFELGDLGEITPVNQNMYIGGSFNDWSLPTMPMTRVNEIWEYSDIHLTEGRYEMKFANSEDWSGKDWGDATGLSGLLTETTGGGSNINFTISDPGAYNIAFDDNSLEYSIVADVASSVFLTEHISTKIFPNPASDNLTIDPGNMNASRISIFSPSGQELYNEENVCSELTINVSQFRVFGYILVKISDSDREEKHKVMLY